MFVLSIRLYLKSSMSICHGRASGSGFSQIKRGSDLEVITIVPPFPVIDYVAKTFKWVSGQDQASLYEMVPDQHKPIIAFLMLHGCRPGETRALKCKNVDLVHGLITIAATFSKNVYRPRRKGKRAKPYNIPLHPEMREYAADRVSNSHPESFLFPDPGTGRPYGERF